MAVVHAALDKLGSDLTDHLMDTVAAVLERNGLRAGHRSDEGLRAAIREVVTDNLYDGLRDRVAEIEAEPALVERLRIARTREAIVQLLAQYAQWP